MFSRIALEKLAGCYAAVYPRSKKVTPQYLTPCFSDKAS